MDPGTATIVASLIPSLFGGGGGSASASDEAQARILAYQNRLMRQYLPQILGAYQSMWQNPAQDPNYLLYRQSLLREAPGLYQSLLDPSLMDLTRRGVLDSSMTGQVVGNRQAQVAAQLAQQLAQALSGTRTAGITGTQSALFGAQPSFSSIAGGYGDLAGRQYANQANWGNALANAARAYGASTARTPVDTTGNVNYYGAWGGADQPTYLPGLTQTPLDPMSPYVWGR